ncbi:hypothetical protein ASE39_25090 [Acidovorax sp. Root267]|uniref:hypothetical protein n=1 Tax=Acidovorax sp. Root267 TaxID=1736505 RepID=UPI000710135C|nr:hypothetical protein [Acidovorax sp. Root267]KRD21080.1 hypothetical protein ASE39_25090 [Acidovorax sp. Root267]
MAALLAASLTTVLVLHLTASGARWLCLVGLGLLVYAFPLHFLVITLIAAGLVYYLDTYRKK